MVNILALSGGGVRGFATAGVLAGLEDFTFMTGPADYHAITGDSFGALVAALYASGLNGDDIGDWLMAAPLKKLLTWVPWGMRKPMLVARPLSLKKVAAYIDSFNFEPIYNLVINAWDAEKNEQVLYCWCKPTWADDYPRLPVRWVERAWVEEASLGTLITRSMALPGLVADDPRWMDGGLAEHPPMAFAPRHAHITLVDLGFAGLLRTDKGDTTPRSLLDRGLYGYEVTASIRNKVLQQEFPNLTVIDPKIYDIDSLALNLSQRQKADLFLRGYKAVSG